MAVALSLAVVQTIHAATPGLPLTEGFDDADLRAPFPLTTADWSIGQSSLLLPPSTRLYGAMSLNTTISSDLGGESDLTTAVELVDIDGDADLDVIVGNHGAVNRLFLNDGDAVPYDSIPAQQISPDVEETRDLVAADFDSDGDIDVAVCNGGGQPVRLYLNRGDSQPFNGVTGISLGVSGDASNAIAAGDFNNDGHMDLLVGNGADQHNLYYLNNGTGNPFEGVTGLAVGSDAHNTVSVDIADIDSDGDADIVVANAGQVNRLYLNNGTATPFAVGDGILIGLNPGHTTDIRAADLNGDGFIDVLTGELSAANSFFLNNGTANPFTADGGSISIDINSTYAIDVADMDNDGDFDVVVANGGFQSDQYSQNLGTAGLFTSGGGSRALEIANFEFTDSRAIAVGDVDGDGDLDAVVGNRGQVNRIHFNGSSLNPFHGVRGTDLDGVSGAIDEVDTRDLIVADVNGDALPDIIAANESVNLLTNGDFENGNLAGWVNTVGGIREFRINDGSLDPPSADGAQPPIGGLFDVMSTQFGNGSHELYQEVTIPANATSAELVWTDRVRSHAPLGGLQYYRVQVRDQATMNPVATATFRATGIGDTALEAAYATTTADLSAFIGKTVRIVFEVSAGLDKLEVQLDDVRLVVGAPTLVHLNFGNGRFINTVSAGVTARALAVGDFDKDGDLDLAVGRSATNSAEVLINDGNGGFGNSIDLETAPTVIDTKAIAAGDIDGDGDLDVVTGRDGFNRINFNQFNESGGSTLFTTTDISFVTLDSNDTSAILVEDIDGDGDLDVVAGNGNVDGTGARNRLYLNNGTSNPFNGVAGSDISMDADATVALAAVDVDGDGDVDIVAGNFGGQNKVYLNDGTTTPFGTLGTGIAFGGFGFDTHDISVADFNRDGHMDMIAANVGFGIPNMLHLGSESAFFYSATGIQLHSDDTIFNTAAVATGDLDLDGDPDVVLGAGLNAFEANRYYLNGDSPTFFGANAEAFDATADNHGATDSVSGDIDGDGDEDVIVGVFGAANRLYLNVGSPTPFGAVVGVDITADADNTTSLDLKDIDGDGDLDLLVGNSGQVNRLYLNNGTLDPFNGITGIDIGMDLADTVGVRAVDMDCDGDMDVSAVNRDGRLLYYANNGTGDPFAGALEVELFDYSTLEDLMAMPQPILAPTPSCLAIGDLNGDSYPDWVVGFSNPARDHAMSIILNNRSGGVGSIDNNPGSGNTPQTSEILIADVNLDGVNDLVEAVAFGRNQVWIGLGDGMSFFDFTIGDDFSNTRGIALGDIDLDGDLDLFAANGTVAAPAPDLVFLSAASDGGVAFNPFTSSGFAYSTDINGGAATVVAELTGDGLPDVFTANGDESLSAINRLYTRRTFMMRPSYGTSLRTDTETEIITAAKLTPNDNGELNTEIDYYLSNDGGSRYHRVKPGRQFVFPGTGTDLRWRAELKSLSPLRIPKVFDINLLGPAANGAPVLADINVATSEDVYPRFEESQFLGAYTDPDWDGMQYVRVVSLPGKGTLKLSGAPVAPGQDIPAGELGNLVYENDPQEHGPDGFAWNAFDGTAFAAVDGNVVITVEPVADTPSVTGATTDEDVQSFGGLRIQRNPADGNEVTHYKITNIRGGSLFQNDGSTPIANGDFITALQGDQGLTFTPAPNSTLTGTFEVQASVSDQDSGIGGAVVAGMITIVPKADTPVVTNAATPEDVQTSTGLVVARNVADGSEVTHFQITAIQDGRLFRNDGVTEIFEGDFITFFQGRAGLRFSPGPDSIVAGSFLVRSSLTDDISGLGGGTAMALITVLPVPDTPQVTGASTLEDTQTTSGLVIDRNASDGAEVTHFRISAISGGTLYQNDGLTRIFDDGFVTHAEGMAGLRFRPAENSTDDGSFMVQGATGPNSTSADGPIVTANITVASVNDPPVGVEDFHQLAEGGMLDSQARELEPLLVNDTDVEGDTLVAELASGPRRAAGGGTMLAGFGADTFGQLAFPTEMDLIDVAAGTSHSLGLRRDGTVVGWGGNDFGQATPPTGLTGVVAIAAGGDHSLALKNDGAVVAWGRNDDGQATPPIGLSDVAAITAGPLHSVALKTDGSVVAWGHNGQGQSAVPVGLAAVRSVYTGGSHNLALKNDGTIVGWGDNTNGEITMPPDLGDIFAIAGGYNHSVALKVDGTVLAWGSNTHGQTNVPMGLKDVVAIECGPYHTLALKIDGTIVAWGRDQYGESTVPMGVFDVVRISANVSHNLLLTQTAPPAFSLNPDGSFVYTHDGSETSVDSFVYRPHDGDEAGNLTLVNLRIDAVNKAPSVMVPGAQTVSEDQQLSIAGVTVADPDARTNPLVVTLSVENGTVDLAASGGLVLVDGDGTDGTLGFTGAQDAVNTALAAGILYQGSKDHNGNDLLTVTVNDQGNTGQGAPLGDEATVAITVTAVNDAPSVVAVNPPQSLEDGGPIVVSEWAGFSPGPVDEDGQNVVEYTVSNVSGALTFMTPPAVAPNGDLTYEVAPDAHGSATFDVKVKDDGGVDDGGVEVSVPANFTIIVKPVNDPPLFTAGPLPGVLEDSGANAIPGWVTSFDAGSPEEPAQMPLLYVVNNIQNPGMFAVLPHVSAAGELTYTLAANAYGAAMFDVTVYDDGGVSDGGINASAPLTVQLNVIGVNDQPDFVAADPPASVEDAGEQTVPGWATLLPGGLNETDSVLMYEITGVGDPGLFASGPVVTPAGDLVYQIEADKSGSSTFTLRVRDDGGMMNGGNDLSVEQTFTINVAAVNDAPSFAAANPPTVLEDAGQQTVAGWAGGFDPGPVDEAGQSLQGYVVSNVQPGFFAVPPTVAVNGDLVYMVADNAFGTGTFDVQVRDNGGVDNEGSDLSFPSTFTVNVTPVNDAPGLSANDPPAVFEDSGEHTVVGWAAFTAGAANESDGPLEYLIGTISNPGLFASGNSPSVTVGGDLVYAVAPDAVGQATFEVSLRDDGGVDDGGVDISTVMTFTITVVGVNDPPAFTAAPVVVVQEDSGAAVVSGWVTSFSAGPADEVGQAAQAYEVVSVSDPALFTIQPTVSFGGDLSFTVAGDAWGSASIGVVARDSGGLDNGGANESPVQTFGIEVTPLNDAPSFVASPLPVVNEDAEPQTIPGWATFDPGPANEADQSVNGYAVTVVSNPGLFAAGGEPAVSTDGSLTYALAEDANGTAEFDVMVTDDGGFAFPGDEDTSAAQRFALVVRAVNDAPSIVAVDPDALMEDSGPVSVPGWLQAFVPGPDDEAGQSQVQVSVVDVGNPGLFESQPVVDAGGNLIFTPAADSWGTSTFDVQVRDNGSILNGGVDTSIPQQFTITVNEVNDRPEFTASNPPAVAEDAGAQVIPNWATFDPGANESGQSVLEYIITPPTDALFSFGPTISPSGQLSYTPAANANGVYSFTVAVRDDGGMDNGGVDVSETKSFEIVVSSVNDTPMVVAPGSAELEEDGSTSITGISVSDADAGDDELRITLSVGHGELALRNSSGVTVTDGDGMDGTLVFEANQTQASIVLAAGVDYTPSANFNGRDTLVIAADDLAVSEPDGNKIGQGLVAITVDPIADTPMVTNAVTDEDVQTMSGLVVARNLSDGTETTHMKITGIMGGVLYKGDGQTVVMNGEFITADEGAAGLRFTPAEHSSEDGSFQVQASINGNDTGLGGATVAALITVNSVNDPPVIELPAPTTAPEDGSALISNIVVSDVDAGVSPLVMTLSVNHGAISLMDAAGLTFGSLEDEDGSDGIIVFSAPQGTITDAFKSGLLYVPTPDYDGSDTLAISANDQGESGGDPEIKTALHPITIPNDNDRPTTVGLPDFSIALNSENTLIDLGATFDDVEDTDAELTFTVAQNSNPGLFDSVSIDGAAATLTLDYATDKHGSSIVTIDCQDTEGLRVSATFRVSVFDIQKSRVTSDDGAAGDWFGWDISISGDWLAVGAHHDDDAGPSSGAVYVFERLLGADDEWKQRKKLTPSDASAGDQFGRALAISGDTIIVGAHAEAGVGAAYVFQRDHGGDGNWGEVAKLSADSGASGDHFGWSVDIDGDTVLVGASQNGGDGSESGVAYVFERDEGGANAWGQTRKLMPSDGAGNDWFGNDVSIDGSLALIGSPLDDDQGVDSGSAYLFGRDQGGAGQWGEIKKFNADSGGSGDWFGWSVALDGDTAVAGASRRDGGDLSNSGSVFVFVRDQGGADQWGRAAVLNADDAAAGDSFGFDVSVSGETVLVGAHGDDDLGDGSGSIYLFGRNHGGADLWGQAAKLSAVDGASGDAFGYSVAVDADSFAVGAPNQDSKGDDSGSAYLFRIGGALDLFRAANFSAEELADPDKEATVWGDQADPDGDGLTNFFEFVAGINPIDQASLFQFRIELVPGQPTHRKLIFGPIVAGREYTVEVNNNLGIGAFVPLEGMVEDNGDIRTVTDANATGFRVYRVQISLP